MNEMKRRLDDSNRTWTEELPSMLWAYWTTLRRSTRETPFSMTYGAEVMILVEVELPTSWTGPFEVEENNRLLGRHLDLIKENHEVTSVKLTNYQQRICRGYNKGMKCKEFILGDLVLKKVLGNTRDPTWGKLGPN